MASQDYASYIAGVSQAATITGSLIPLNGYKNAFITTQWTAGDSAAIGTQSVEGSNDNTNWYTLRDSAGAVITFPTNPAGSGAGTSSLALNGVPCKYMRVVYTKSTAGTGLFSAQVWLS